MKRMHWGQLVLVVVLGLFVFCASLSAAETIKIGVVGPRTGTAAATGKAFEEGIDAVFVAG